MFRNVNEEELLVPNDRGKINSSEKTEETDENQEDEPQLTSSPIPFSYKEKGEFRCILC